MTRLLIVLATCLLLTLAVAQTGAQSAGSSTYGGPLGWCVAVWHPSSEHPGGADSLLANADVIDIVFPFWFTPDAEGRILVRAGDNWRDQVAAWKAAGLVVVPSVFATHSAYLSDVFVGDHIAELVALVEDNDFDGLDLDYEEFPLSTKDAFSSFVERLGAELRTRGKILSVTVHAKTEADPPYPSAAAQDWPRLAAAADMFNVMTYDWTNRNEPPGPIAPRSWVAQVAEYGLETVGAEKLLIGMPFYGYVWKRDRPPAVATTWQAVRMQAEQFGIEPEREPDSGEISVRLDVTGLPRQVSFVSDAVTTAGRLASLAQHGHLSSGVAIWGIGGEDPESWNVLRAERPGPCNLRK